MSVICTETSFVVKVCYTQQWTVTFSGGGCLGAFWIFFSITTFGQYLCKYVMILNVEHYCWSKLPLPPSQVSATVFALQEKTILVFFLILVPAFIVKPPQNEYRIRKGSNVTLKCKAFGIPRPTVLWHPAADKLDIRYTQRVIISGFTVEREFSIHHVATADSNNYTCIVVNTFGNISRETARVTVLGRYFYGCFFYSIPIEALVMAGQGAARSSRNFRTQGLYSAKDFCDTLFRLFDCWKERPFCLGNKGIYSSHGCSIFDSLALVYHHDSQ